MNSQKTIHILLVEDNEGDIILTMEALKEGNIATTTSVVRDGEQAIEFLNREKAYAEVNAPDLVLLDINLPKIDGKEVLHYIKSSDKFRHIPVVMLTTSLSDKDVVDCYRNYASCYIPKPVDLNKFMDVVQSIENFWTSLVKFPGRN